MPAFIFGPKYDFLFLFCDLSKVQVYFGRIYFSRKDNVNNFWNDIANGLGSLKNVAGERRKDSK